MSRQLFVPVIAILMFSAFAQANEPLTVLEKSDAVVLRDESRQDQPITLITLPLASVTPDAIRALKDLDDLPALELIGTGSSDLSLDLLQVLQQKPTLKRLTIAFAKISEESAARLGTLKQLESLHLQRRIEASPHAVDLILKLTGLKELTISGRMIDEETLERISTMNNLRSLGLESPFVTDTGIQSLRRLRQLRSLTIYLGDRVSQHGIGQLADLSLADIHITLLTANNDRVKALRKISGLKDLKLVSARDVNDDAVADLTELTELQTLVLSDARLSNAGIRELRSSLPKCQIEIDNRPRN